MEQTSLSPAPPRPPLASWWTKNKGWIRPASTLVLVALIVWFVTPRIHRYWDNVATRAQLVSVPRFLLASVMFALFLVGVRAVSWRRILRGFGHDLPPAPAVRIWITSELARYVPGSVLQLLGRAVLAQPYGVSNTVCAASQVLELVIFLLANILVGICCLAVFGFRSVHGQARLWLILLAGLAPLLVLLLHPRAFYGGLNALLKRMNKPPLLARLPAGEPFKLLAWAVVGLLWQSVAVFLIVQKPLGLHWSKWYVVAGSYCLAWCAGFLVVVSPGGIGVREPVFVVAMRLVLPHYVQDQFAHKGALDGLLFFLSALLRLWTITGELIVATLAYTADLPGAMGKTPSRPNASESVVVADST
jgi:hypothetical protein